MHPVESKYAVHAVVLEKREGEMCSHVLLLFCRFRITLQDMNYQGSTCICRVPRAQLRPGTVVECVHCGCRGCSSSD